MLSTISHQLMTLIHHNMMAQAGTACLLARIGIVESSYQQVVSRSYFSGTTMKRMPSFQSHML